MNYGHSEFEATAGDVVHVALDAQANVLLLDPAAYRRYRQGNDFRYYGGWFLRSPATVPVPHSGHWHVVVDAQGASLSYSVSVCPG